MAILTKTGFFTNEKGERERYEFCDECGDFGSSGGGVADVFWDGSPEHGLADDPKTGQPITFSSRGEKARYLKEHHLRESGDRVHGSAIHQARSSEDEGSRRIEARASAERALATVRAMGRDFRRQEYLKVLKESRDRMEAT